jgi:sterol 14alpha-demethylase
MPILLILLLLLLPLLVFLLKPFSLPDIPNATPSLPLIGNALYYGLDPVGFLKQQRAKHGDVVLVDLALIKVVFFLGADGTNAILKGTEKGGISFWAALRFLFGGIVNKSLLSRGRGC